jgi:hypothetical protein
MKKLLKMLGPLTVLILFDKAPPASAGTNGPVTLTYSNLVAGAGTLQFALLKFDPSLGSLKAVHIAFNFSGTLVGTAVGVTQAALIDSTITHWVFFDFMDLSDNVFIAEPTLALKLGIPAGAQNTTISFGPEFLSTSYSFSVTNGDSRFEAWANGPGTFNGTLRVFFTNTGFTFGGLQFYPGSDGGVYNGWLSIAYEYEPLVRDSDGDGVTDDVDECPNTSLGDVVDEHGCSIAQLLPCEGPRTGGLWKNHGKYVSAIASEVERFLAQGRITQGEAEAMVEAAAKSDCGKKR